MTEKPTPILRFRKMIAYGIGIFGLQLFIGYVNSFQMEFYNKMYSSFDSNIFIVTAIIILVAKIISCLADPIIGSIIDRSNLKGGKMRPWILISAFPIAIMTTVMFIFVPFQNIGGVGGKIVMYAYITITTVLWNISMSFADIPSQGMLSLMSPVESERNNCANVSNLMRTAGLGVPGVFVTIIMLILQKIKNVEDTSDPEFTKLYFLVTAIFFMVFCTLCYLTIYWSNRETVKSTQSNSISMKTMFKELKDNKLIRIVFLVYMLGFARNMAMGICVQAGGALVGKIELFGFELDLTSNATWLIGITSGISAMISLFVAPVINKKLGEKKTYVIFAIYGFVVSIIAFIVYACMPQDAVVRHGIPALIFIFVVQFLVGFMFGTHGYIPLVMTADICDYREWKTGERKEGVAYAILSMSIKLANALSVAGGLLLVGISGYTATATITPKMQNIIFLAYIGIPGVSTLLSMIPMFKYHIDAKTKREMHERLTEMRLAVETANDVDATPVTTDGYDADLVYSESAVDETENDRKDGE